VHIVHDQYAKAYAGMSERTWEVVDALEHALLGMFPRARYGVGTDVRYIYLPLQWMPEWLGDWLADILFRLPTPAGVMK